MAESKFPRGAFRTPGHKLLQAEPHIPPMGLLAPPPQFGFVPKQLSYWDNNVDGDCVTAEEAYAKGAWSAQCGLPDLFIPDAEVVSWASQYGFLNGAMLTDVMDQMAKIGFTVNSVDYKDGPYQSVDYSTEAVLQSALTVGCVKVAIDANALPSGAGNQMGWFATGGQPNDFPNTDHCVAITGYGPASYLFGLINVPVPASIGPTQAGYLVFTWNTVGFVDHAWIMSTVVEAWVRNPTTVGQTPNPTPVPPPPGPGPGPGPTPVPPLPPVSITSTGTVEIPEQTLEIEGSIRPRKVTIPGQAVPVSVTGQLSLSTVEAVDQSLRAKGVTPESLGLTPAQWQAIIALILQLLPLIIGGG